MYWAQATHTNFKKKEPKVIFVIPLYFVCKIGTRYPNKSIISIKHITKDQQ